MADGESIPVERHDIASELATLGGIMLDNSAMAIVATITAASDYSPAHCTIFESMLALWDASEEIGVITVSESLRKRGLLNAIGGLQYLGSLQDFGVTGSKSVERVAEIVRSHATVRTAQRHALELLHAASDPSADAASLTQLALTNSKRLAERATQSHSATYYDCATEYLNEYESRVSSGATYSGIATGLDELDELTGGLLPTELIVIAADTGQGKSSLALCVCLNVARATQRAVMLFSLEMQRKEVGGRGLSIDAGVDLTRFRTMRATVEDTQKFSIAARDARSVPLWINHDPRITLDKVFAECSIKAQRGGLALVVLDYIQLLALAVKRSGGKVSEYDAITDVSRELKLLAMELQVPVIALSQFNRAYSRRAQDDTQAKPGLADLKGSSAIGQDANMVLLMTMEKGATDANIYLAKHRSGKMGEAVLAFDPTRTRFYNRVTTRESAPPPDASWHDTESSNDF